MTSHGRTVRRRRGSARCGGFTLIEAALTTVIIGTGVLALVAAQQAFMSQNAWAQRSGTAMLLASEIRELTLTLPMYDPIHGRAVAGQRPINQAADIRSVADLIGADGEGLIFGPDDGDVPGPINARPAAIEDMDTWRQRVRAFNVHDDEINVDPDDAASPGQTNMLAVIVIVEHLHPQREEWEALVSHRWVVTR